jgi:hypothetical protein
MLAMSINEFPSSVACLGANLVDTDTGNGEMREVSDTIMMVVEFPSGAMIYLAGSTINERGVEDVIRGNKANLLFGGGKVQLQPERPYAEEIEASDETPPNSGESHPKHHRNFIEAMRNNTPPSCNIELAIRVQTIVSMAEMSVRKQKLMRFDPLKLKLI